MRGRANTGRLVLGAKLVGDGIGVDEATLEAVRAAYDDKYGWPVTIEGDAYDAPYGAPTAGPPPYAPYAIVPETVFAFGTDDAHAPHSARFRF